MPIHLDMLYSLHGTYRGRIYVAANHSSGSPKADFTDYFAHGFYTDDHGKTFKLSENVTMAGGNENMAAELSDDKLMLNLRNQRGDVKARIIAISSNGGSTWTQLILIATYLIPFARGVY
jgi:sialidase-1